MPITSVELAKAAFPHLRWRDQPSDNGKGKIAYVICGGDKQTGDIIIFLALEDGAATYEHVHIGSEHITVFAGELCGVKDGDDLFVLSAGESIDLEGGSKHRPYVQEGGFCLLWYRQTCGHNQFGL